MYFKISGDQGGEPNVYIEPINNEFACIQEGIIVDPEDQQIELPFRFNMKVRQNPDATRQNPRLRSYNPADELMHKDLLRAIQAAGVDNLQVFPAILSEKESDILIEDYVVINVVGLVSCAAVDASDSIPFADGLYFNKLVIDPAKTNGLLMFRLAESKMDVLIHESVAKILMKGNFPYLVLTPLEQVSK